MCLLHGRNRKAHVERVARFIRIRGELAWRLVPRDRSNYCYIVVRILRGSKAIDVIDDACSDVRYPRVSYRTARFATLLAHDPRFPKRFQHSHS